MASSQHPDDFQVIQSLKRILGSSDLTKLTRKEVRKQLEQELGGSFSSPQWKARIKEEIEAFVRRKESGINNHSHPLPTASHANATSDYNINPNPNPIANKRRKLNDETAYSPNNNNQNQNQYNLNSHRKKARLQSNRALIQKSEKDHNCYFMKLPGDGVNKRCIMHKFRSKIYVGFREYYEKNGEQLPTKKGLNLNEEQWEFVVKHIDDINAQIKLIKQ